MEHPISPSLSARSPYIILSSCISRSCAIVLAFHHLQADLLRLRPQMKVIDSTTPTLLQVSVPMDALFIDSIFGDTSRLSLSLGTSLCGEVSNQVAPWRYLITSTDIVFIHQYSSSPQCLLPRQAHIQILPLQPFRQFEYLRCHLQRVCTQSQPVLPAT